MSTSTGLRLGAEGLNGVVELADEPSDIREVFSGVEQVEPVRTDDFTGDEGENFVSRGRRTTGRQSRSAHGRRAE